ncbi:serine O-acetyltransferase [Thermocoleostomius sinensis]|uniref:Serine acetyltransferase n=1 Tax=Thermocoleostomius sinensis A174 TaxID=2016057 RepID=A0A9E9CA25_9CYAN|nr:serine O-acetyltransferase [Thermocoleostomius sinensis]WAL58415.1 serine O-acetyltransferase [Thermocoleostomius sinensis A174]
MLQFCDRLLTQSILLLQQRLTAIPLFEDFQMIFERDPATRNWLEAVCCYPGLHAILCYRFAHWLHLHNVFFFPRLISHLARLFTGIEIHPAAVLGKGIVIDHGIGVVIGETAIVGDYTLIYQGVTLGGTGKESGKRHPTVGNHVIIGAGAKVLGNIHIGSYARIGAGSIVLRDVPAYCTAVGVPGRNLCQTNPQDSTKSQTHCLEHNQLPDPDATALHRIVHRIEQLEQQVQALKQQSLEFSRNPINATVS